MSAKRTAKSKESPTKRTGELSAYRWGVGFDEVNGKEIKERAHRRGTKPAIWLREAGLERLQRERAAEAAPGPKR